VHADVFGVADNALTTESAWPELDGCWSDDADRLDVFDHDDDPTPVTARRPLLPSSFPPPSTPVVAGAVPAELVRPDIEPHGIGTSSGAAPAAAARVRWWNRFSRSRSPQ